MKNLLAPAHLDDLKRSGLNDETINAMGVFSIPPSDFKKYEIHSNNVESAYCIPYPGMEYYRLRLFYREGTTGPKYLCPKGSKNHLYIPESTRQYLHDSSIPLYLIEGEKKTMKACQDGLPCIGLSGLWNWSNRNG